MRVLGREHILVPESSQLVNFRRMIVLNPTAAYLWEALQDKDFDAALIRDLLLEKYDVDPQTAFSDAESLITKWSEAGIL